MLQVTQVPAHVSDTPWWSILVPTDAAAFWAMVAALAGIAVVVVAWRALDSLKLTQDDLELTKSDLALSKQDIVNRVTRETVQCAFDRCDEMCLELIPIHFAFLQALHAKGIPLFVDDESEVSFREKEEEKKISAAIAWLRRLDPDLINKSIGLINRLECWSMYFTHDPALANQKVAYEPCSNVFCQMVMTLYPSLLAQRRANPAGGPYQNLVTLFKGWYAAKTKGPLLEQLERTKEDGGVLPETFGTGV
ncbi:MAG: hypothetical protein ACREN6_14570 [Gemmatimonadaceae bacterium]